MSTIYELFLHANIFTQQPWVHDNINGGNLGNKKWTENDQIWYFSFKPKAFKRPHKWKHQK